MTFVYLVVLLKDNDLFGEDLSDWKDEVESVTDPTTKLHLAVTYLRSQDKLKLSGNIPSVDELTKDKEKLDNFLLSVSRALNHVINVKSQPPESDTDNNGLDGDSPNSGKYDNMSSEVSVEVTENPLFDASEFNRIYSPILNQGGMNVFKQLSFIIPENPRSIKRILNIYSLVRIYREYKYGINRDTFDSLSINVMKFIILLERWPYATSLMIEVINRLNYERRRFYKRNHNSDKKELSGRILNYFEGLKDYNSLELYCLYDALEQSNLLP